MLYKCPNWILIVVSCSYFSVKFPKSISRIFHVSNNCMKFLLFSEDEKKLVDEVFNNAMNVLSEEDRGLPQVVSVLPLLRRGIGNKHAVC